MVSVTFLEPVYLWLLLAVPLIFVAHLYFLRNAKRRAMQFANFAALKRATGTKYVARNQVLLILRIAIVVLATLGVARTIVWYEGASDANEYIITIDTSASMAARDLAPDRLSVAKRQALAFVDSLDADTRVGVVSFSGVSFIEEPLTDDRSKVRDAISRLEIEASGTDIPGAIITSANLLATTERGRMIILVTDGSNTISTFESDGLRRASGYAQTQRVRITTIGVGTPGSGPIGYLPTFYNVSAAYNADNLAYLANATGGEHWQALDEAQLAAAYAEIRTGATSSTLTYDATGILMACAVLLLLVEWVLGNTRYRSLP
jgi:Ca-activated chloride channel family protein